MDPHRYRPNHRARVMSSTLTQSGDDFASAGCDGVEMYAPAAVSRSSRAHGQHMNQDEMPMARMSGRNASRYYAAKRVERDQEREKLRQEQSTPKAIEKMLKDVRSRPRRRGPVSSCPNPISIAHSFLADPVTRFWLVCNLCTVIILFTGSVLFMTILYPVLLRPSLKY